jgi:hypothetical protein
MKHPAILLAIALPFLTTQAQIARSVIPTRPPIPDVPITDPDPAFPLRVHIPITQWGGIATSTHGYGTLNLLDPTHPQGFDFAFSCTYPFHHNQLPDDLYQARWKHQPYELEILTGDIASNHAHTCTLHLAPEPEPFRAANAIRLPRPVKANPRLPWMDPGFAYQVPDPDYPLRFHVADAVRNEDSSGDHGYGTANLADPTSSIPPTGADFRYDCYHGFMANSQRTTFYQGHWIIPNQKLEILLQRPGTDKVDRCTVSVALKSQTYADLLPQHTTQPATPVP